MNYRGFGRLYVDVERVVFVKNIDWFRSLGGGFWNVPEVPIAL